MPKDLQVIEVGEGWIVRREGELMIVSMHDTQQEAIEAARKLAEIEGVHVLVQGRDGRYRPAPGPTARPAGR